jgi:hypothetical protein
VDVVATDVDEKNDAVGDDDVTRPAAPVPSAVPGRTAEVDENASAAVAQALDDTIADALPAGRAWLKRLAPDEGASDDVALSRDNNLLGRSQSCDIPLFSATASRQHATIVSRRGEWFLSPVGGKTVIVDGRPAYDEIRLRHEMRIQLGGDELVFLWADRRGEDQAPEEETLVTSSARMSPPAAAAVEPGRPPAAWIAVCSAAVVLAALAFWLLL